MLKILTLTLAVALLAGCAQRSAPLSLHARAHHQAAPSHIPHRTHLTGLGCAYLRERLGLPALGSPPPAAPGISDAQPSSPRSPSRSEAAKYLASHTNCAHQPQWVPAARPPFPPAYTPPAPGAGWPAISAYYPPAAQRIGAEGTALLRVCIGVHGHLRSDRILHSSGSPLLDQAALRYARASSGRWRPAARDGRSINACTLLPVRFSVLGGF